MAVLKYNGPWDQRELWGVTFHAGKTVEVDDPKLVSKALSLEGFERVDAVEAEPPKDLIRPRMITRRMWFKPLRSKT